MQSNLTGRTVADILRTTMSDATGALYVVNPTGGTIEAVVDVAGDDGGDVRLLAPERTLKDVLDDFLVASRAADLVADGHLQVRATEKTGNTLLVDETSVVALVTVGDRVTGLTTRDASFTEHAFGYYSEVWTSSVPFDLRTPGLSHVRETLESAVGAETAADFDAVLAALESARGDEGLDEVTISLLVAARNRQLLYDISKWGEDVGIASKATFSRTKTHLEERGLITTEKVPIDVGRPRLRLLLDDDRLRGVDAAEFAAVAQSLLAGDR